MYVTRRVSELLKSAALVAAPPDGPNSGYLVIQDEESETYSCFGSYKSTERSLKQLPFPQDKELTLTESSDSPSDSVFFIPLLNHPLSSNFYYAIVAHGEFKGEAFTCSREEDVATCCFCCVYVKDTEPGPLDPHNIYQQFEIVPHKVGRRRGPAFFSAKSTGSPPSSFLRDTATWTVYANSLKNLILDDAPGLDSQLRARLPQLHSPEACVIGKWYTPFMFVKEATVRSQVERSMYYVVTLEQRWEQIFSCVKSVGNSVVVDARVEKEQVFVGRSRATWNEKSAVKGVVWYKAMDGEREVGLRVELVERMKWEQRRGGWMGGGGEEEREVKINKVEEFEGVWNEFGCYVLVETFNLRRLDGSLVMSFHFKHFHHLKTIWE